MIVPGHMPSDTIDQPSDPPWYCCGIYWCCCRSCSISLQNDLTISNVSRNFIRMTKHLLHLLFWTMVYIMWSIYTPLYFKQADSSQTYYFMINNWFTDCLIDRCTMYEVTVCLALTQTAVFRCLKWNYLPLHDRQCVKNTSKLPFHSSLLYAFFPLLRVLTYLTASSGTPNSWPISCMTRRDASHSPPQ